MYVEDVRFVSMNIEFKENNNKVIEETDVNIAHGEKYLDYDFVLYSHSNPMLVDEYEKMFQLYRNDTNDYLNRPQPHSIDGGVLLKKGTEIIAGIFYHSSSYIDSLFIRLAYVNKDHRGHSIHKQLHACVDIIAKSQNRKTVYSTILHTNTNMTEHAGPKIGYEVLNNYSLVSRPIDYINKEII
jgi:hypothetical protein